MKPFDLFLALAVMVLWGGNYAAVKIGVGEAPPLFLTALRFSLVALLLLPWVRPPRGRWRATMGLSVTFAAHFGLLFWGMTGVDVAATAIIMQLGVPFSVVFAAKLLGDRLGWQRMAGMAIAFSGVVLLVGTPGTSSSLPYLLLVLAAAVTWGLGNVQIKGLAGTNIMALTAWMALFQTPLLVVASLILEEGQLAVLGSVEPRFCGALAFTVVGSSIVSYGLWYRLLGTYEVSRVVPFSMLAPVFGVLAGVMILGETLTVAKVIGGPVTLGGVAMIQFAGGKRVRSRE